MRSSAVLLGFAFSSLFFAACSQSETAPQTKLIQVKIELAQTSSRAHELITSVVPSFVGLGVGEGASRKSHQLSTTTSTTIEVPVGAIAFRSTLVSTLAEQTSRVMYVSQSSQTVNITPETTEITLSFSNYVPTEQVNVYGLIHESSAEPASNAQVSVQDPLSGAWLVAPGYNSLALTNEKGAFGFSLPLSKFLSQGSLTLRVVNGGVAKTLLLPVNANGKPGVTLPSINLTGSSESVVPTFTNLTDFDNDGTPNTVELSLGTNPFSELSGQAGPVGPAGPAGSGVRLKTADGGIVSLFFGGGSSSLLKFSDGVIFPNGSSGFEWSTYSMTYPWKLPLCTNAAGTDFSTYCGNAAGNSSPYYYNACYYNTTDCTGTCLVPFKPVANRLIPACVGASSGGGTCTTTDFRKTTGQETSATAAPNSYKEFYSSALCTPVTSPSGTPTFWALPESQKYTFPAGITYPLGTLYLVE